MPQSGGHKPRHGSLAFRPRSRARKQNARVSSWPAKEKLGLLGFAGYKAGMTHLMMIDDVPGSPTANQEIAVPVTIVEVPPLKVFGVRVLEKTPYGLKNSADILISGKEFDKNVKRIMKIPKRAKEPKIKEEEIAEVRVLAYTQPVKAGIGKRTPDIIELAIGGKTGKEKFDYAKSILGKEISVKDAFQAGEFVDTISVTKGKGWQGVIQRFHVEKQRRKATGKVRHMGSLGPILPAYVMYTTNQAGQLGYSKRIELNKRILKIGENPAETKIEGGIPHYGVVKNNYILVSGSVGGAKKRLVKMRKALRVSKEPKAPQITYISLESKQGART